MKPLPNVKKKSPYDSLNRDFIVAQMDILTFYTLFNDAASISGYRASNEKMIMNNGGCGRKG